MIHQSYKYVCRRKGSVEGEEEIILDLNKVRTEYDCVSVCVCVCGELVLPHMNGTTVSHPLTPTDPRRWSPTHPPTKRSWPRAMGTWTWATGTRPRGSTATSATRSTPRATRCVSGCVLCIVLCA